MIDPTPVLIIHLSAGYTEAGRSRSIAMIVNAQGFTLAFSDHDPPSNLRDALTPGAQVVSIIVTPGEIRERRAMAAHSGRMLRVGGGNVATRFAAALSWAEQKAQQNLNAIGVSA